MPSPHRAGCVVAVFSAVVSLGACTVTFGDPQAQDSSAPTSSQASSSPVPSSPSIDAPGRLAVLGADGTLMTTRPDGSDAVELHVGDGSARMASQPTWSPDGARLAWVEREGGSASIGVAGPRGEGPVRTPVPLVPFYLSWDPTATKVAFLGAAPSGGTVLAGVLDVGDGDRAFTFEPVGVGEPFFFFAWSPDGRAVLAHLAADRLEQLALDGTTETVTDRAGAFATPTWVDDTRVWVERAGQGRQRLVASSGDGRPSVLATMRGAISFVARPDGGAIAFQALEADEEDVFAPKADEPDDGVRVVDLDTGRIERATGTRAMSFWWSPVGRQLLVLSPDPGADGSGTEVSWRLWEKTRADDLAGAHTPTLTELQEYAPFFTQYAQSATPWAPDASAFAFAAGSPGGTSQVYVQTIGDDPEAVADGVYVAWSPSRR